jgi:hypothetical protein
VDHRAHPGLARSFRNVRRTFDLADYGWLNREYGINALASPDERFLVRELPWRKLDAAIRQSLRVFPIWRADERANRPAAFEKGIDHSAPLAACRAGYENSVRTHT